METAGGGQVQFLGGTRVAQVACGDDENLELSQGQGADKIHGGL